LYLLLLVLVVQGLGIEKLAFLWTTLMFWPSRNMNIQKMKQKH
jgi:hypothetical protein